VLTWIDQNPWLSAALCFLVGALFGGALRVLRRERHEQPPPPHQGPQEATR